MSRYTVIGFLYCLHEKKAAKAQKLWKEEYQIAPVHKFNWDDAGWLAASKDPNQIKAKILANRRRLLYRQMTRLHKLLCFCLSK